MLSHEPLGVRFMGRRLLGDRPTTGAERKRRWRERQRERRPDFDPSGDGTAALMSRALPAPSTTEALDTAHGARRVEDEQFDSAGLTGFPGKSTEPRAGEGRQGA